jgi:hypothetical protein
MTLSSGMTPEAAQAAAAFARYRQVIEPREWRDDRSFPAFVRAIRYYPGFIARVAAAACFFFGLMATDGLRAAALAVLGGLGIGVLIGYPIWRTTGTRR